MKFAPTVTWDKQVEAYLESSLGTTRLKEASAALCRPSLHTCLRVNTLRTSPQEVVRQLQQLFPGRTPYVHPRVSTAVILPGRGPLPLDIDAAGGREVVINRLAGEAVLQGAHVYAPGLLAATSGLAEGDLVAVTVALEQEGGGWFGVNRGMRLTPELQARLPDRQQLCVGVGRVTAGRRELFKQQQGLAVEIVQRVFDVAPCNGVLPGDVLLQSLPCVVAAQALDPQPGSRVLDMCAAPGGKTSMLAQLMMAGGGNSSSSSGSSQLVALDRTAAKVARVQALADTWGVGGLVQALTADATQLYQQDAQCLPQQQQQQQQQPALSAEVLAAAAQPESFDAVLLDAPCSALGLRPRLLMGWRLPQLTALAAYQRALLHSAVHVLRPGGCLVYCTCTLNPGENESNVRYVLDRWPGMRLVQQPLVLGGPGLSGPAAGLLTPAEAQLVQRFDPAAGSRASGADDTIGFFIAKFVKHDRC